MSTVITRAEVKKHRHRSNLWMIIHDEVYDVSKFVEEHPGGEDTLLDAAGTDATVSFEDVGHSEDARELLKKYKIGILPDAEKTKPVTVCCKQKSCGRTPPPCYKSCTPLNRKGSCSDCTSVSSVLTSKSSKSTRFVVPPDKCDEVSTSTSAPGKVVVEKENSHHPRTKKKKKGGGSWKWLALAAFIIGAIAVGAMVVKKNA